MSSSQGLGWKWKMRWKHQPEAAQRDLPSTSDKTERSATRDEAVTQAIQVVGEEHLAISENFHIDRVFANSVTNHPVTGLVRSKKEIIQSIRCWCCRCWCDAFLAVIANALEKKHFDLLEIYLVASGCVPDVSIYYDYKVKEKISCWSIMNCTVLSITTTF